MNPQLRHLLIIAAVAAAAVWLAWLIAEESYALPGLAFTVALSAILVRVLRQPLDVILLSLLLFGYLVGNRGFAQLMPAPSLPLLPAEAALLVSGLWGIVSSALERRLPWDSDPLSLTVLAWVVLGSIRLFFDLRTGGFLAIRDFAMCYYALFFFIAHRQSADATARQAMLLSLVAGSILLLPVSLLFTAFPGFFLTQLTLRGTPLIYYKGDLLFMYVGMGSVLIYHLVTGRHRAWATLLSVVLLLYLVSGDNRASQAGAFIACLLLLLTRRWRYPALVATSVIAAVAAVAIMAAVFNNHWAGTKLSGAADRLRSLADPAGQLQYASQESSFKGDNNRFRLIWWRNVLQETWNNNPAFGLGFGYDLAHGFVQEYSPEAVEEFTTRSPHNIFVSVFGRLGFAGLALWSALCLQILRQSWRALRSRDNPVAWSLWAAVWIILVTACFGVVLEGPMGAVPFWILLALAARESSAPAPEAGKALAETA